MTHPNRRIAIIGAGPAGMSCALWCSHWKLAPILIDSNEAPGGLSRTSPLPNVWMLGNMGMTGEELSKEWSRHMALQDIPVLTGAWVESVETTSHGLRVTLLQHDRQRLIEVAALVLATGERPRGREQFLDLAGFESVEDAGRIQFGTVGQERGAEQAGKRVIVLGGGDNAYDTARLLAPHVEHLYLVMRGRPRAQLWIREEIANWVARGVVTLHQHHVPESFLHAHDAVTLNLLNREGELVHLQADHLYGRLGFTPNSEAPARFLAPMGDLSLLPGGHIATDLDLRTNLDRVYAAGDVANPRHPCVPTAIAHGTMAARSIEKDWFQLSE